MTAQIDPTCDWLDDLPLVPGPPDLRMGLRSLDIHHWMPVDDKTPSELELRRQLLDTHDDLVRMVPGHDAAVDELMSLVGIHLRRPFPPSEESPLEQLAVSVPDDVLLLWRDHAHWRLVGGALLFPNQWSLDEKLGRTVGHIHAPVAGYDELLEHRVDQFFDRLTAAKPVWRRNWFLHDEPTFHRPDRTSHRPIDDPAEVDELWIRSEWQTLRRLAFSGLIVFTVKTQVAPIRQLAARPLARAQMIAYLEAASRRALENTDVWGRQAAVLEYLQGADHPTDA